MKYRYRNDDEFKVVKWDKIPKSWKYSKAQYYFDVFAGGTPSTNNLDYWNGDIPWINSGEVQNCLVKNISRYITEKGLKESSTKLIKKDTVLLAMTGATCGNVGYLTFESTANQSVMAFIPKKKFIDKFLYYYLMCQEYQIEYYKTGGAQGGINVDNGKKIYINIPSVIEQEKIANFLDEKTSQFHLIISKKEELIKKLEEAKKSLISEVVTGKVNVVKTDDGYELVKRSSEEMKDSGVEWLGEIPKDWEVKKFKYLLSKIGSGKTPKGGSEVYQDKGVIFIRSQNVHNTGLRLDDVVYISHEADEEMKSSRVQNKDVLLNITGASIGRTSIFEFDNLNANVNQHVCILRPKTNNILPTLLNKIIQSDYIQEQIQSMQTGSSREGLNFEQIGNMSLVISEDIKIQESVDMCLDEKINNMNAIINKTKIQINKLKEAKQSLISEAVTGKIEILD
ncbi:restriction endonuclease subunit S [Paraclostridium bifermentans]|uniref:restriction endonuclease subunit S n=1 Tax=Paraclostridium bifermentans TaxID=1490 RepID=UPI00242D74D3|nr:restriction endonuclease subunit S [Paraclostridium bifermentans]